MGGTGGELNVDATGPGSFESLRPRLQAVAYRMTGSVADAQDVCQDAWLRWQALDPGTVDEPEAYLVRVVTHLSIDRLRSAQRRREAYVGPYLPEPVVDLGPATGRVGPAGLGPDPAEAAELSDSLTFAFLVLLDELTPVERAVLLLHDVFGYPFDEVAAAVDRTPEACRQIASRTRRKLDPERRGSHRPAPATERELLARLLAATVSGDVEAVVALLAPDVVHLSDGGPDRYAARRPVVGPDRVARLLVNLTKRLPATVELQLASVNGEPGIVLRDAGRPDVVLSFSFAADGRVRRVFGQLNPDKLRHLA